MFNLFSIASLKIPEMLVWGGIGLVFLGAFSILRISGFGLEVPQNFDYAPAAIVIALGFFMTWGGAREFRLRDMECECPDSEPTKGDIAYLEEFKKFAPMTGAQLRQLSTRHDREKHDHALLSTISYLRTELYKIRGDIVLVGNQYFTKEQHANMNDETVINGHNKD